MSYHTSLSCMQEYKNNFFLEYLQPLIRAVVLSFSCLSFITVLSRQLLIFHSASHCMLYNIATFMLNVLCVCMCVCVWLAVWIHAYCDCMCCCCYFPSRAPCDFMLVVFFFLSVLFCSGDGAALFGGFAGALGFSMALLHRFLYRSLLSWMTLRSGSVLMWWEFFTLISFFLWFCYRIPRPFHVTQYVYIGFLTSYMYLAVDQSY